MRRKTLRVGILWRLIIALILAPCLGLVGSNPVAALNLEDYFSLISTVELSKTQVTGNELFNAMVEATGSVTSDLPVLPSEAEITSRIIATHQANGANVTLNSGYTVTIDPFPIKTGDARQVQLVVPLQFPQGRQSGTDSVVAELIGAIVTVLGIPLPITDFVPPSSLPPPQTVGSVTYVPPPPLPPPPPGGGGGGDGGGGGVPTAEVSISGLSSTTTLNVDEDGMLQETSQLETLDKKVSVAVAQGTKLLDAQGEALGSFSATAVTSSPEPPSQRAIVYAYDFGPDGATFDPPISLTITYDESLIPENVVEENLSMAIWDEAISKWVVLDGSTVDPENNTITAPVSHFTTFAVLAYTALAVFVVNTTAAFGASKLSVTPAEVGIGEKVTVSTLISNTGEIAGSYKVTLRIDNEVADTEVVTLESGASEEVTFTITRDIAGSYAVDVDGLSGTFVVKGPVSFVTSELAINPSEVGIGEAVTISALITNTSDVAGSYKATLKTDSEVTAIKVVTLESGASEEVTFTIAKDVAGSYAIDVDGLSGTFVVKMRTPPEPFNWWLVGGILVGGIIVAFIALVVVLSLTVIHRRRA